MYGTLHTRYQRQEKLIGFYKLAPQREARNDAFAQEPMQKRENTISYTAAPQIPSQPHTYKYGFTCSSLHSQNLSATPEPPSLSGFCPRTRSFLSGWFTRPHGMTTRKKKKKKSQSQFCAKRELGIYLR